jgi:hypothetical protein
MLVRISLAHNITWYAELFLILTSPPCHECMVENIARTERLCSLDVSSSKLLRSEFTERELFCFAHLIGFKTNFSRLLSCPAKVAHDIRDNATIFSPLIWDLRHRLLYAMSCHRAALCLDRSFNQVRDLVIIRSASSKRLKTNHQVNTDSMQIPRSEAPARIDLGDE